MNEVLTQIQSCMKERNWTLYRLAKESGIPYSSLNSLFQKDNQPTISTLEKICYGFQITLSEFFSFRPPYREPKQSYSSEEKAIIDNYRLLDKRDQALLLDMTQLLLERKK